jgi:hypothetical protein
MSAATPTKIFGIRVGIDPKWLVGGLIVIAVLMFWFNSRSEEHVGGKASSGSAEGRIDATAPASVVPLASRTKEPRRASAATNERGVLRLKPVDARDGKVDPTLRLYLLKRLQSLEAVAAGRSLFETGPDPEQIASGQRPIPGPKIPVNVPPMNAGQVGPGPVLPVVNIPLKFYGFVNPASKKETTRGLFLDGENILIAAEGDLLNRRYLVVQLSANSARLEDVEMKQGQTLPVVPEAMAQ